jgi:tetratricopeptide (TPR) repeat protein
MESSQQQGRMQTGNRSRAFRRVLGFGLAALLFAGIAGAAVCKNAWRETRLREAYLPEIEAMTRRDPYDAHSLAVLAARLCEARQFAAAGPIFERAAGAGDRSLLLWRTWAATVAADGEPEKALAVLKLGIARIPEIAPALKEILARCQSLPPILQADGPQLAEKIFPNGIQQAVAHYTAGSFLNGLAVWQGRRHPEQSGFATREQWAREQPNDAQAQRLWGEALLRNRRLAEAVPVLKRAASLAPDSPRVHLALGDALAQQGQAARAGLEYLACLRRRPNWMPALLGLGKVSLEKQLTRIGLDAYQKATQADPRCVDAWVGLGEAHFMQRLNMAASLAAYERAAQLAPARTDFYGKYSNTLRAVGNFAEAERVLQKRLAAAPDDASAHYLYALMLLDYRVTPERRQQAEAEMHTALRLEPGATRVAGRLGRLLVEQDRPEEAIPLLEQALRADPYNLPQLTALGRAYRQTGQLQKAQAAAESLRDLSTYLAQVSALEDRIYVHPRDVRLHLQLADLYRRGGEREKARFHQETATMLQRYPKQAARGVDSLSSALYGTTPLAARPEDNTVRP